MEQNIREKGENAMQYFWLILLIGFIVAECLTVGLVSIWFAGGSLISMILAASGVPEGWQIAVFFVVSGALLVLTRPLVKKYINSRKTDTNYQSVIGEIIKITERVDNLNQSGAAIADGKEWTARSVDDAVVLETGALAVVDHIDGVKLMVKPYVKETKQEVTAEE